MGKFCQKGSCSIKYVPPTLNRQNGSLIVDKNDPLIIGSTGIFECKQGKLKFPPYFQSNCQLLEFTSTSILLIVLFVELKKYLLKTFYIVFFHLDLRQCYILICCFVRFCLWFTCWSRHRSTRCGRWHRQGSQMGPEIRWRYSRLQRR